MIRIILDALRRFASWCVAICSIYRRKRIRHASPMAISTEQNRMAYYGNGSTSTPYSVTYRFDDPSWLIVNVTDKDGNVSGLYLGSGFTVSGDGTNGTGQVRTVHAVPATSTVTISRNTPLTQVLSLVPNAPLPAKDLERVLDHIVMAIQDTDLNKGKAGSRALVFPSSENSDNPTELPIQSQRKDKLLGFDSIGKMALQTYHDIAYKILALFGGAPSSTDVLAAIAACEPLHLTEAPTNATPGKLGQMAIVSGRLMAKPELLNPWEGAPGYDDGLFTWLIDLLKLPFLECGYSKFPKYGEPITTNSHGTITSPLEVYKSYSISGVNPANPSEINPLGYDLTLNVYYTDTSGPIDEYTPKAWILSSEGPGSFYFGSWRSADLPDNPWDVSEWIPYTNESIEYPQGGLSIEVLPVQLWINTSEGPVAQWKRLFTSDDFHPSAIPAADPHRRGELFLSGTALNVSLG